MLKKKLGLESIERMWNLYSVRDYFKIPSSLTIPEGCVEIGDWAFCYCWGLREVTIPKSVKRIGYNAFWDCFELKEAVIPGSVEEIDNYAFGDCKKATIILNKPENVERVIRIFAFYGCRHVKEETEN